MLIYEVHLATAKKIHSSFLPWLEDHMREILSLPGFTEATWFQPSTDFVADLFKTNPDEEAWVVQYRVENSEYLHEYLNVHAPRLRADGPGRFGQDLRIIGRRVLAPGNSLSKGKS